jgi:hypothetical protein
LNNAASPRPEWVQRLLVWAQTLGTAWLARPIFGTLHLRGGPMTVPSDPSRRDLLKVMSVGGGVVGAVSGTAALAAQVPTGRAPKPNPVRPGPIAHPYLSDLPGNAVGPYQVISVGPVDRGAIAVALSTPSGVEYTVDVLRVDPNESHVGIGAAGRVGVFLRNGGNGQTATDEEQGLGAMALAHELLRREQAGEQPPSALLTRGERDALERRVT